MIAQTAVRVEPGGVLGALACQPPLTLRQVHSDLPGTCRICLVGTSAGPLSGDELSLRIDVAPHAHAGLGATGASIAQGRAEGRASSLRTSVHVGAHASLDADPGPLIVCAGSRVDVEVEIELDESATIYWREVLVLGRSGEPAGRASLRWDVVRGEKPLLRQRIDLTDPRLVGWSGLLADRRVLASCLIVGPGIDARTQVESATCVVQRLAEHAVLATVLATDAAQAKRELDRLCVMARGD